MVAVGCDGCNGVVVGALVQALLDFVCSRLKLQTPQEAHTHLGFIDISSHHIRAQHGIRPTWHSVDSTSSLNQPTFDVALVAACRAFNLWVQAHLTFDIVQ